MILSSRQKSTAETEKVEWSIDLLQIYMEMNMKSHEKKQLLTVDETFH